jgi:murein DD-endopeptidase MepM/ murein hydrolase activator NlpD
MLIRIARNFGVKFSALLAANGLEETSVILPGRKLTIPAGGSSAPKATIAAAPAVTQPAQSTQSAAPGWIGPELICPVPGATFMNDWGFPRGDERFHEGTDMFAPKGTTIVAPVSGYVSFGSNGLGGTTFNITTADGWEIYGAHLSATIGEGGQVAAGTPIGRVGNSGDADGGDTHLHIGVRPSGGLPANPYPSVLAACS